MNVDNFNTIGFYLLVGLEVFFMYKYAKYWLQILSTIKEEDGEQSMYSEKKLNDAATSGDFTQGYGMIFSNISVSTKIVITHPVWAGRGPTAWAAGSARASRMAVRALRLLRRPVSTIEQRAA
jgi:hypothetical protein